MDKAVLLGHAGDVAIVTLNRPEVLNALDERLLEDFIAALRAVNADERVGAVVLTGAGTRAFSAGQDLAMATELTAETVGPWSGGWAASISRCAISTSHRSLRSTVWRPVSGFRWRFMPTSGSAIPVSA